MNERSEPLGMPRYAHARDVKIDRLHRWPVGRVICYDHSGTPLTVAEHTWRVCWYWRVNQYVAFPTYTLTSDDEETVTDILCTNDLTEFDG